MSAISNKDSFILDGLPIFNGESFIYNKTLQVKSGKIIKITPSLNNVPNTSVNSSPCQQPKAISSIESNGFLAPAFIDCQINGGGGVLFNNNLSVYAMEHVAAAHARKATTRFLATIITDSQNKYLNLSSMIESSTLPESVVGFHAEGPFIAKEFKGAHNEKHIQSFKESDLRWLKSLIKKKLLLTLDVANISINQIQSILDLGILISFGHSNASYDKIRKIISLFTKYKFSFTHLFNAMPKYESRKPGIVGAGLDIDSAFISLIVDGKHLHDATVRLAYKSKPKGKVFLVSDAMSTVSAINKKFKLYEQEIEEVNGKLVNKEGSLSGATVGLSDCVKYAYKQLKFPLNECLKMASLYPARFLSIDNLYGKIEAGYTADIVHFDDNLKVLKVWRSGILIYNSITDPSMLAWTYY